MCVTNIQMFFKYITKGYCFLKEVAFLTKIKKHVVLKFAIAYSPPPCGCSVATAATVFSVALSKLSCAGQEILAQFNCD